MMTRRQWLAGAAATALYVQAAPLRSPKHWIGGPDITKLGPPAALPGVLSDYEVFVQGIFLGICNKHNIPYDEICKEWAGRK